MDLLEDVDADADDRSRSEYIRRVLRARHSPRPEDVERLHAVARELRDCRQALADERQARQDVEARRNDLRRQLAHRNKEHADVGELVRRVEAERNASLATRLKWLLFGKE